MERIYIPTLLIGVVTAIIVAIYRSVMNRKGRVRIIQNDPGHTPGNVLDGKLMLTSKVPINVKRITIKLVAKETLPLKISFQTFSFSITRYTNEKTIAEASEILPETPVEIPYSIDPPDTDHLQGASSVGYLIEAVLKMFSSGYISGEQKLTWKLHASVKATGMNLTDSIKTTVL